MFRNSGIQAAYAHLVEGGKLKGDPAQSAVVERLAALEERLASQSPKSIFSLFSRKKQKSENHGIYIWGDVGRGKSMLMDLFFTTAPIERKRRVHFHSFMLDVHERLHTLRQQKIEDPLPQAAKQIAGEAHVLCFDEFQVTDITDAMILARLFQTLFERGVVVVATSNRPPDDLYLHGLQRQQFLPFIALIKQVLEVVSLDSPHDYRMSKMRSISQLYYTPLGPEADAFLNKVFEELASGAKPKSITLQAQGREVTVSRAAGNVARLTFAELCEQLLGAADYLAIAKKFDTLLLSDIPKLSPEKRNEAKRFVTLIDTLYEHKVKLVCTAETQPHALYFQGDGSFEFKRTISRLIEMQSTTYVEEREKPLPKEIQPVVMGYF